MTITDIATERELSQFVTEYAGDQYCLLELLRFWGRHPRARFSRLAIVHALDSTKLYIERALRYLVKKGAVSTHTENNISPYSLTEDESLRGPVLDLAKLDSHQWQLMIKDVQPTFI